MRRRRCTRTGVCQTVILFSYRVNYRSPNERTTRRSIANTKKKTRGPARSASSIMWASTPLNGFNTVSDFCRIWSKLIPSSAGTAQQDESAPRRPRAAPPQSSSHHLAHSPSSNGGSPSPPVQGVNAFHQFCTTIVPPNPAPLAPPPPEPIAPATSFREPGSSEGRPA